MNVRPQAGEPRSLDEATHEPALAATIVDPITGTRGYIVADTVVGGMAMGGTRIAPGVTLEEAATLARMMSLKLALAGVAIGGSKGAVDLDPSLSKEERERALAGFGRAAGPLLRGGVYIGTDLGCSYPDRALIHHSARYRVRDQVPSLPCSWGELWEHCQDVTGLGVAEAAKVAADILELPQAARRISIQGFGEVGQAAARAAIERGFQVVSVADKLGTVRAPQSLPIETLCACTDAYGTLDRGQLPPEVTHTEAPEAWLDSDAEVLILAAVADAITPNNHERVRARLVVEGANQPTAPSSAAALHARGIVVIPDLVANAGGAIGCGLALRGDIPTHLDARGAAQWLFSETIRRVGANTRTLLSRGGEGLHGLREVAYALAQERLDAQQRRA